MVDGGGGEVAVVVARLFVERGWGRVVRALPCLVSGQSSCLFPLLVSTEMSLSILKMFDCLIISTVRTSLLLPELTSHTIPGSETKTLHKPRIRSQ